MIELKMLYDGSPVYVNPHRVRYLFDVTRGMVGMTKGYSGPVALISFGREDQLHVRGDHEQIAMQIGVANSRSRQIGVEK